jgi:hypothetical protein
MTQATAFAGSNRSSSCPIVDLALFAAVDPEHRTLAFVSRLEEIQKIQGSQQVRQAWGAIAESIPPSSGSSMAASEADDEASSREVLDDDDQMIIVDETAQGIESALRTLQQAPARSPEPPSSWTCELNREWRAYQQQLAPFPEDINQRALYLERLRQISTGEC